jgi:hypothetical protein
MIDDREFGIQTTASATLSLPLTRSCGPAASALPSFSHYIAVDMTTELEKSRDISPLDDSSPRDWDALRLQSLAPGGFGDARAYIWHAFLYGHFLPFFF